MTFLTTSFSFFTSFQHLRFRNQMGSLKLLFSFFLRVKSWVGAEGGTQQ